MGYITLLSHVNEDGTLCGFLFVYLSLASYRIGNTEGVSLHWYWFSLSACRNWFVLLHQLEESAKVRGWNGTG